MTNVATWRSHTEKTTPGQLQSALGFGSRCCRGVGTPKQQTSLHSLGSGSLSHMKIDKHLISGLRGHVRCFLFTPHAAGCRDAACWPVSAGWDPAPVVFARIKIRLLADGSQQLPGDLLAS